MFIKINSTTKKVLRIKETLHELADSWSKDEEGRITYSTEEGTEYVETNLPLSYETKDSDGNNIIISFTQSGHIIPTLDGTYYHLKWDGSEVVVDDISKDTWELAEEWTQIRAERTRLLAETDHLALSDQTLSAGMKTYRTSLRDLPSEQSSKTKYSDITWPTKP